MPDPRSASLPAAPPPEAPRASPATEIVRGGVRSPAPRLYDAHNHLQDDRFNPGQSDLVTACVRAGVLRMVVNGSCEDDWPKVLDLARAYPRLVLPSFGLHPWYVQERTPDWQKALLRHLDEWRTGAAVGEMGLDRWKSDLPYDDQESVFLWQLDLAARRNLPVSIHCLRAWGRLYDLLRSHARPVRGFLLHSYGGPRELVEPLARLGAYFSFPGAFAHERKSRQREAFRAVPLARLLLETDAPDQLPPKHLVRHPLGDPSGPQPLNHPANLVAIYSFAADLFEQALPDLAAQVEANFNCLFGP
jgi:TatD DNase family protein